MEDLRYAKIQTSLLRHFLPFCLEAWREELRGLSTEYAGFVECFYPTLADCDIFDKDLIPGTLPQRQTSCAKRYSKKSTISGGSPTREGPRVPTDGSEHSLPNGVLLPDLDQLWTAWWSLGTIGRAIAVIQYISCLMYASTENPVFVPWTPKGGGGPPVLWEFEGPCMNTAGSNPMSIL